VFLQDKRDGVTTSSKEQTRSSVRVRVQGEITYKGGKDQGGMTDHPRVLRRKVQTSCEKTPVLIAGMTTSKWHKSRGLSPKCQDEPWGGRRARTGPWKGLGRSTRSDRPRDFLWRFGPPFDLGPSRSICSSLIRRPPHPTILPPPITRKPPSQDEGESWMSSMQGSMLAEGRKQEEDSKPLAYGCYQASLPPSSSTTFSGVSSPLCASILKMMGYVSVHS
jgi:hypothetical protein